MADKNTNKLQSKTISPVQCKTCIDSIDVHGLQYSKIKLVPMKCVHALIKHNF